MAMLSDRTGEVLATTDENADGRIDERDDRRAARRVAEAETKRADTATDPLINSDRHVPAPVDTTVVPVVTDRGATVGDGTVGRARVDESLSAQRRLEERTATATKAATTAAPAVDSEVVAAPVVRGPRPRASLTATVSLLLGVVGALAVLSGQLAGPGVAVGLLAAIMGLGGLSATSRRHVAGKSDAFLGIALGLAAVVVGVLAVTGNLSWLNGDTDMVARVHEWLTTHAGWLLP